MLNEKSLKIMLITSAVWMYGMLDTNVFYECLMSLPGKELNSELDLGVKTRKMLMK